MSFAGVPGICCAIWTACRTKSWLVARRPNSPPSCTRWMSQASMGRSAASDAKARAASAFCVAVHTSQPSSVQTAAAFIGSIVEWCWQEKC
jgi:hypothetical protein